MSDEIEVEASGETVLVGVKMDGRPSSFACIKLTTREAFDFVTDMMQAIDQARGYGEAIRGEVAEPRSLGGPKNYKTTRRARP